MPWFLSIPRAWNDCARPLTVCWTCSLADNLLIVTPRFFRLATCSIPDKFGGGEFKDLFLIMMISFVFVRFNYKLLVNAQCSTFCNSAALVWISLAGVIRYVSSAYLRTELPRKVVCMYVCGVHNVGLCSGTNDRSLDNTGVYRLHAGFLATKCRAMLMSKKIVNKPVAGPSRGGKGVNYPGPRSVGGAPRFLGIT